MIAQLKCRKNFNTVNFKFGNNKFVFTQKHNGEMTVIIKSFISSIISLLLNPTYDNTIRSDVIDTFLGILFV